MVYQLSIQAIDYLLYNYQYLREEVDLLFSTGGGLVRIVTGHDRIPTNGHEKCTALAN